MSINTIFKTIDQFVENAKPKFAWEELHYFYNHSEMPECPCEALWFKCKKCSHGIYDNHLDTIGSCLAGHYFYHLRVLLITRATRKVADGGEIYQQATDYYQHPKKANDWIEDKLLPRAKIIAKRFRRIRSIVAMLLFVEERPCLPPLNLL